MLSLRLFSSSSLDNSDKQGAALLVGMALKPLWLQHAYESIKKNETLICQTALL